ncbi:MAG: protein kinase [Pyrinomonadaceae bacterium]|nr:protein kinase [Pyrinomonadaceae bacterium]
MPACPECASEVADNDIYCPYCGISLSPANLPSEPEDPLAHTIVTSISELPIPPLAEPNLVIDANDLALAQTAESTPQKDSEPASEIVPEQNLGPNPEFEIHESIAEAEQPIANDLTADQPGTEPQAETPLSAASLDLETTLHDFPTVEEPSLAAPFEESPENAVSDDIPLEASRSILEESPTVSTSEPSAEAVPPYDEPVVSVVAAEPPIPEILADRDLRSSESVPENTAPPLVSAPKLQSDQLVSAEESLGNATDEPPSDNGTSAISDVQEKGGKSRLQILTGGTVLNSRYEIIKKIGGGGMGAVYLSTDRNLGGVQRAVKEMVQAHIEDAQQTKAIDDFRRESMILSSLDHPSIPTIYDYFFDTAEGRFYLVMKYISGGDLAGRLRAAPEGRIDELTVSEWGFQIADVLSYLHNLPQRIVYRDLKPSNVMLDGSTGKIMLIDFGIARSVNQIEERGVTAVGTMGYAPPELFSGNVEPRSDIYSLGSTMFHLMTGADPQNNPLLIFDFEKNPRPRQINPRLSDQIEKILMKCVEYSAEKRFASAADLRNALGEHADNLRAGRVTFGVGAAPVAVGLDDQTVFCGFCGQRIVAADMFCAFCGARQPLAQNSPPPASLQFAAPQRSARTARLIVEGTTDLEAPVYLIEKQENLLGRRDPMSNIFPEVDLSKFDPQTKISRRHARIIHDGADFLVEDLGSSNGTTVFSTASGNLRLRPNQPHRLLNGDKIKLGDTTLHFWVG